MASKHMYYIVLDRNDYVTATGFKPTTTKFLDEHPSI